MNRCCLILIISLIACGCGKDTPQTERLTPDQIARLPHDYFYIDSFNVDVFENGIKSESSTYYFQKLHKYFMYDHEGEGRRYDILNETWNFEFKTNDNKMLQVAASTFTDDWFYYPDLIIILDDKRLLIPLKDIAVVDTNQVLSPIFGPPEVVYNTTHGIQKIYYPDSSKVWVFNY